MLQVLRTFFVIGLIVTMATQLTAQKNKNSAINVTTTIYDNDTGGTPLLMRSDNYNGSGFATYFSVTTKGKVQSTVTSTIDAAGNWALYWSGQRAVWLTPNQQVGVQPPGAVPIPPAGYYDFAGQSHSICRTPEGAPLAFQSLGMGIGYNCQLGVEFHYGGLVYKLAMGPDLPWGGPATGVAQVVCNNVSNNQCASWTIRSAPDSGGQNGNVANLYYYDGGWIFVGQYYNSFRIDVTNP